MTQTFRDFLERLTDEQKEQIINDSIRIQNMVFEKTGEDESDSFSEDWFEDDELNHKIDNMLMNGGVN